MTTTEFRAQAARFMRRALFRSAAVACPTDDWPGYGDDERAAPLTFVTSMGTIVATQVWVAATFVDRFVGLLRHKTLSDDEGLLFAPGGSIHTLGMCFAIDVLFLDRHMRVLKVAPAVGPWRTARAPAGTQFTLEVAAGRVAAAGIGIGMRLLWSETE